MPQCQIKRFREAAGGVPFDEWVRTLTVPGKTQNLEAVHDLAGALNRLADEGHVLRRPTSAPLRDGIHELRFKVKKVNYRVLYFFAGAGVAVIAHGCTKEGEVDDADIDRAVSRRKQFEANPKRHTAPAPPPK